jgi:hypothetical protein
MKLKHLIYALAQWSSRLPSGYKAMGSNPGQAVSL